jgi:hypothetical protein
MLKSKNGVNMENPTPNAEPTSESATRREKRDAEDATQGEHDIAQAKRDALEVTAGARDGEPDLLVQRERCRKVVERARPLELRGDARQGGLEIERTLRGRQVDLHSDS